MGLFAKVFSSFIVPERLDAGPFLEQTQAFVRIKQIGYNMYSEL